MEELPGLGPSGPAWPTFLGIGGMKCGSTALHELLAQHPHVATSSPKELNFFFGGEEPSPGDAGTWHRGTGWYRERFDAGAPVRGESSPGYTSPAHPEVAERVARLLPDVRLVHLVREPIARMVSQHAHHVRDGTERRPLAEALLDPTSQYVARSRYAERLAPFLERFPRGQLAIVVQEELAAAPDRVLAGIYAHLGADPGLAPRVVAAHEPAARPPLDADLQRELRAAVEDDVAALAELLGGVPWPSWR